MRPKTRMVFEESITKITASTKALIRPHMDQGGNLELSIAAFSWNVLQEAANRLKEELQNTPEGRAVMERGERARAGDKPS